MALQRVTRTDRAAGILRRHEVAAIAAMPGLFHVRDTITGSGTVHIASASSCDCYDAGNGHVCKHMTAVRKATTRIEAIPVDDGLWDVIEEYTGTLYRVHGSHCSCTGGLGDCIHLQTVRASARQLVAYGRRWDADAQYDRTHCPKCGAPLESDQAYIGGRYVWLDVCRAGGELHYSRRG